MTADAADQKEAPSESTSAFEDPNSILLQVNDSLAVKGFRSALGVDNYLGVRYGHIPGRFLPSSVLELDQLKGRIDATQYGPRCPQATRAPSNGEVSLPMSETECLHLNVYNPPAGIAGGPFPVFAWIFGGAYVFGHNGPSCDGNELVKKSIEANRPIVVVTLNYRLNFFGFFTSDELLDFQRAEGHQPQMMPGYGDQRNALLWIQKYISLFNGDPKRVTLSGTSAGGVSIYHHLRGRAYRLFKHCIIRSGPPRNDGFFESHQARFDRVIKDLSIASDASSSEKVAAIQGLSPEELVSKMDGTLFQPCPDPEWLLPPAPGVTFRDLEYWTDLPQWVSSVTMGATRHESIVFGSRWRDFTDAQVDILLQNHLTRAVYDTVVHSGLYCNQVSPFERFLTMSSEAIFIDCTVAAAEKMTERNAQPVFMYLVDTKDAKPGPTQGYAAHSSDSAYIWGGKEVDEDPESCMTTSLMRRDLFATMHDETPWQATSTAGYYKSFDGSKSCLRSIRDDLAVGHRYPFASDADRKDFHRQGFDCTVTAVKQGS